MSPDALNSLFALCIGFALAGALSSGFQAFAERPAGFGLLQEGVTWFIDAGAQALELPTDVH